MTVDSEPWRVLCEETVNYEAPVDHEVCFNALINIWRCKCQVLNRRLSGTVLMDNSSSDYNDVVNALPSNLRNTVLGGKLTYQLRKMVGRTKCFSLRCFELSYEDSCTSDQMAIVFHPIQMDPDGCDIKHVHIPFPYRISCQILDERSLRFTISVSMHRPDSDYKWLRDHAYPGLVKWMQKIDPLREMKPTNKLLDIEQYAATYRRIKETSGQSILKNWTEKTDPQKFVFEDCGIATYLLETFRRLGKTPRYFADIGCGNGLLVHLLNKEGVNGVGLDIRKRKIWEKQFADTDLREVSVDPTNVSTGIPDGVDYLIGNHSDELTPWIPIMAARMNCDFILIPCCPFDFLGKYTARAGDCGSSYEGFLNFTKEVCRSLGYIVEEDRMSIPSTKRVCFVCTVPPEGLRSNLEGIIETLTLERNGTKAKPFTARPVVSAVRNCSNIASDDCVRLTSMFFNVLLEASDEVKDGWRCGGDVPLPELARLLSDEDKALMKQQNGGLQTFLKNQHQVFQIVSGCARIRDRRSGQYRAPPAGKTFQSDCWMAANHPDGCPLGEDLCTFRH